MKKLLLAMGILALGSQVHAMETTQVKQNYYKILGVPRRATDKEIKEAFKALALKHHPDKPGADQTLFIEIKDAYETLTDQEKRADYDLAHTLTKQQAEQEFFKASKQGNLDEVKDLYKDYGVDVNITDQYKVTPLIHASSAGDLDLVKFLVENDANINMQAQDGRTALILASQSGELDIVKFLVENGADISIEDKILGNAVDNARWTNHPEVEMYLMKKGGRPKDFATFSFD